MSTKIMDALPKNAKNAPNNKKSAGAFMLKLKPTEGNNVYRFRLLAFTNGINTRDWPFIEKFVHEKWDKDAEGKGIYKGFVTCPATKYVKPTLPKGTDPFKYCPICSYVNSNFVAYKESQYKDKIAGKAVREFKRRYVALVPVYVVKDPHEPTNMNKPRVWVIKDKEVYEKLNNIIKKQQLTSKVFNGGKAVDLLVYVKKEEKVINEGQPNEFKYFETTIDKFGFGKNEYEIPTINEKFIEEFPFDDEFYTFSDKTELDKFYTDNVLANSNIPEESIDDEILETSSNEEKSSSEESIIDAPIINASIDDELAGIDEIINSAAEDTKPIDKAPKTKLNDKVTSKDEIDDIDSMIDDVIKS